MDDKKQVDIPDFLLEFIEYSEVRYASITKIGNETYIEAVTPQKEEDWKLKRSKKKDTMKPF